jgi:hypothetical protein
LYLFTFMDGIKSEGMPFILIKLFTGEQLHINLGNIRKVTFIIIIIIIISVK